ncbi:MAG: J domain-containing protein [Xanthomonadales bacterium]|nr:J domain-containing protein [Xanthomonadales bacterium]
MSWEAVDLALALHAAPRDLATMRARALPEGVDRVLRLALGQEHSLASAAHATGQDSNTLVEAARFFIEQLLLARECEHDPWRVLGLAPGSELARIREHHQLLVRLVHPDRSDEWASVYADRVSKAWRQLRHHSPEPGVPSRVMPAVEDFGDGEAPPPRPAVDDVDAWKPAAIPRERVRHEPQLAPSPTPPASPWRTATIALLVLSALATTFWLGQRSAHAPDDATIGAVAAPAATPSSEPPEPEPTETVPQAEPSAMVAGSNDEGLAHAAVTNVAAASAVAVAAPAVLQRTPTPAPGRVLPPAPALRVSRPPAPPAAITAHASPETAPPPSSSSVEIVPVAAASEPVSAPPPAPSPAVPAATSTTAGPSRDETLALLDRYTHSYSQGDLNGLLALFAREVHNDPRNVASIAGEYSRLFGSTNHREIRLHDLRWHNVGDRVAGEARFEASYQRNGRNRRHTVSGRIAFELIHDAGQSRLLRLVSRDDGGS